MSGTLRERTLALAGIFQATRLVDELAQTGRIDEEAFATCVTSVLETDAASTEAVYGDSSRTLNLGLRTLLLMCDDSDNERKEINVMRYLVSLMVLEKKLSSDTGMLKRLGEGICDAKRQIEHFSLTHRNVIAGLADLYSKTISTLDPRIMVSGDTTYLSNPDNAAKIRTLLLAGIRSAVLWRQKGGSRLSLVFGRKKLVRMAHQILLEG